MSDQPSDAAMRAANKLSNGMFSKEWYDLHKHKILLGEVWIQQRFDEAEAERLRIARIIDAEMGTTPQPSAHPAGNEQLRKAIGI